MAKISQRSRLRSIYKTMKDLKRDIQITRDSMEDDTDMKKFKTLTRLEKHINKAMKGFRNISESTTGRTHKRGKKYKKLTKIMDNGGLSLNGDNRFRHFGIIPTRRRSGLPPPSDAPDAPDIPIENIQRAFGFTCKVPQSFSMRIKEAVLIRKGFAKFNEEELVGIENNIRQFACYYTRTKILPPDWKYDPTIASIL